MGQEEVYNFIKKQKDFVTSTKINSNIKINSGNINSSLRRLTKNNEIVRRKVKIGAYWKYEYKLK